MISCDQSNSFVKFCRSFESGSKRTSVWIYFCFCFWEIMSLEHQIHNIIERSFHIAYIFRLSPIPFINYILFVICLFVFECIISLVFIFYSYSLLLHLTSPQQFPFGLRNTLWIEHTHRCQCEVVGILIWPGYWILLMAMDHFQNIHIYSRMCHN